jgi:hypothetical protein
MEDSGMIYTTFKKLHDAGACTDRYRFLGRQLGGISAYGKDTPIPLHRLLELNGLDDALWALRACVPERDRDKLARLFACDCAERVLPIFEKYYPKDNRPRVAIETARKFVVGKATQKELDAARAAWAAADAARAAWAAWAAARAADAAETDWQKQHLTEMLQAEK